MNHDYWMVTVSLCLLIIVTRALPFILGQYMTQNMNKLGKELPAYIMLLLVIYEIKPELIFHTPHAWQAISALFILAAFHLWRRNSLLSLIVGTVTYLALLQVSLAASS